MLFFSIYQRMLKKVSQKSFQKKNLRSTTVFKIFRNQHIRMISEGSGDTQDWRNYDVNSALNHRKKINLF